MIYLNLHKTVGCFIALLSVFSIPTESTRRDLRIAHGSIVEYSIPFQVSIRAKFKNGSDLFGSCSGTILNEYWVLTTAFCVADDLVYDIFAGSNLEYDGERYRVVNKTIFPSYKKDDYNIYGIHDIALVKVDKPINFIQGKIEPAERTVRLGGISTVDNLIAKVSGWGIDENNEPLGVFRTSQQHLLPPRYCSSHRGRLVSIRDKKFIDSIETYMLCSVSMRYQYGILSTPCFGDIGSPLIYNDKIIGIMSHGNVKCPNPLYTFYTKLEPYLSWIQGVINQK